ncbi:hypothetical protein [Lacisediminimonas sp.]|uniref:hypothetical protein n=1 Tax=Lacisediminimonas sp. TaxID=3060582 RepID=UPI0027235A72|nr:hypothetical protein [Lacisediminimonas sp.]MDO8300492.1 hypothetical protein [Lacisediminimonas sp.]
MRIAFPMIAAALLLAGCGEKPQSINSSYKPDQKAWQAAPGSPFNAAGYKAGAKGAWDTQMRDRNQAQNEYNKVN